MCMGDSLSHICICIYKLLSVFIVMYGCLHVWLCHVCQLFSCPMLTYLSLESCHWMSFVSSVHWMNKRD